MHSINLRCKTSMTPNSFNWTLSICDNTELKIVCMGIHIWKTEKRMKKIDPWIPNENRTCTDNFGSPSKICSLSFTHTSDNTETSRLTLNIQRILYPVCFREVLVVMVWALVCSSDGRVLVGLLQLAFTRPCVSCRRWWMAMDYSFLPNSLWSLVHMNTPNTCSWPLLYHAHIQ
jgi:hypothetical protein